MTVILIAVVPESMQWRDGRRPRASVGFMDTLFAPGPLEFMCRALRHITNPAPVLLAFILVG